MRVTELPYSLAGGGGGDGKAIFAGAASACGLLKLCGGGGDDSLPADFSLGLAGVGNAELIGKGSSSTKGSGATKSGIDPGGEDAIATVAGATVCASLFTLAFCKLKPHWPQKLASVCTVVPQLGQLVVAGKGV